MKNYPTIYRAIKNNWNYVHKQKPMIRFLFTNLVFLRHYFQHSL